MYKVYHQFPEIMKQLLQNAEKRLKNFLQIKRDAKEFARAAKAALSLNTPAMHLGQKRGIITQRKFKTSDLKDIDENEEENNLSSDEKENSKSSVGTFSETEESEESKSMNIEKELEDLENSETKATKESKPKRDPQSSTKSLDKLVKAFEKKSHWTILRDKIKGEKFQNIQNPLKSMRQDYFQRKKTQKETNLRGMKKRSKEKQSEKKVGSAMENIWKQLKGTKLEDAVRRLSLVDPKQLALLAQLRQEHDPSQTDGDGEGDGEGDGSSGESPQSIGSLRKKQSSPQLERMPSNSSKKESKSVSPAHSDKNIPKSFKLIKNMQSPLAKISTSMNYMERIRKSNTYSHLDIPPNQIIPFSNNNLNTNNMDNQNESSQRDDVSSIASTDEFFNQYLSTQKPTGLHNKTLENSF